MKILKYQIQINAVPESVWGVLWNKESYTEWARAFHAGTYYSGELKLGGDLEFKVPEGHGMFSKITVYEPGKELTFENLGEIMNGVKGDIIYENAYESYVLQPTAGGTLLKAELNCEDDYVEQMNRMFPKALEYVKNLAENKI